MSLPETRSLTPRQLFLAASFLTLGLAQPLGAAETALGECARWLEEAKKSYHAGRFRAIVAPVDPVDPCLDRTRKISRQERAEYYHMVGRAWLLLEDEERARDAVGKLLRASPGFEASSDESPEFRRLIQRVQRASELVASVSKSSESLHEAPATVVVVSAEDIRRRGYLDLEEVFHDLPGFDISRGNGDVYSNLYQRGYRSTTTDRTLFLIDGVEQNDLHSNIAHISRQYALSNVERIEVIYGPASTMYGANAYTGVVNVITARPLALIEEGKSYGVHAEIGGGSFDTRFLDYTVAGRSGHSKVSWSLTGRSYRSDEMNLSRFEDWDYDYELPDAAGYKELVNVFGVGFRARRVRLLDQTFLASLAPASQRFADATDDWSVHAKLEWAGFDVGLLTWRREEGSLPWYTELARAGTGNVLTPKQTAVYLRHARWLTTDLSLTLFTRYAEHELDGDSSINGFGLYVNRFFDDIDASDEPEKPFRDRIALDQASSQIRAEGTLVWEPTEAMNLVAGVELRESAVQTDFATRRLEAPQGSGYFIVHDRHEDVRTTDLGLLAQVSFRPARRLKLVVGGRLDDHSVRPTDVLWDLEDAEASTIVLTACEDHEDFVECASELLRPRGFSVFSGRLALVHSWEKLILKAIYSEAFKDATHLQRYSREPHTREIRNPLLEPEDVGSMELALHWAPSERLSLDLAAFDATYRSVVQLQNSVGFFIPSRTGRFENFGTLRVRGAQASAAWTFPSLALVGNYTYTDADGPPRPQDVFKENEQPQQPDIGELGGRRPVGDIARHRLNLGADLSWSERWSLNVRANLVGDRRTGKGTTVDTNPFNEIDAYLVVHGALSYKIPQIPGASVQLVARNLLDEEYWHPGVQRAGELFAARIPQPGRTAYLRLTFRY